MAKVDVEDALPRDHVKDEAEEDDRASGMGEQLVVVVCHVCKGKKIQLSVTSACSGPTYQRVLWIMSFP